MRFKKFLELKSRLNGTTFFRYILSEGIRRILFPDGRTYFSQEGEDVHVLTLLDNPAKGFYLDIGCNDPIHYSNTFKLYTLGWTGILVDGNPHLIKKATRIRKKDICLHALVSNKNEEMDFYLSDSDLISSVDPVHALSYDTVNGKSKKLKMQSITIDQIIEKYVPESRTIDVLSIDVEGHDFEVLQSISLAKYRPRLIIIEDLTQQKSDLSRNIYVKYFAENSYVLVSSDKLNLYFMPAENLRHA